MESCRASPASCSTATRARAERPGTVPRPVPAVRTQAGPGAASPPPASPNHACIFSSPLCTLSLCSAWSSLGASGRSVVATRCSARAPRPTRLHRPRPQPEVTPGAVRFSRSTACGLRLRPGSSFAFAQLPQAPAAVPRRRGTCPSFARSGGGRRRRLSRAGGQQRVPGRCGAAVGCQADRGLPGQQAGERETAQRTGIALRIARSVAWCAHRGQEATGDSSVGQSQEVLLTVAGRCHCHTDRGPGQAQSSRVPAELSPVMPFVAWGQDRVPLRRVGCVPGQRAVPGAVLGARGLRLALAARRSCCGGV